MQTIGGIVAGQRYTFSSWTLIPPTNDTFSFRLEIQWRDAGGAEIRTSPIKTYTAPTTTWTQAGSAYPVAPAGATQGPVRMVVESLHSDIYVDDLLFGK